MPVWTNLCNRKFAYAAESDFMQVWTNMCDRKRSYAAGNKICGTGNAPMQLETTLCEFRQICAT